MTIAPREQWEALYQQLRIEGRAFIDGEYRESASTETFACISPVDGRALGAIASCDAADADLAVSAARRSFDSGVWAQQSPAQRKRVLIAFADLLLANARELALLETLDMGKPIADSLSVDIPAAANAIRWSAEAID